MDEISSRLFFALPPISGFVDKGLQSEIGKLSNRMQDIKIEVLEALENSYVTFNPIVCEAILVSEKLHSANLESAAIINEILNQLQPRLRNILVENEGTAHQIEKASLAACLVSSLLSVDHKFGQFDSAISRQNYSEAASFIVEAMQELKGLSLIGSCELEVLQAFHVSCLAKKEELLYQLSQAWNQHISWTTMELSQPAKCLHIQTEQGRSYKDMKSISSALHRLGQLNYKVHQLGKLLFSSFVCPIIVQGASLRVQSSLVCTEIQLEEGKTPVEPTEVVHQLLRLFQVLHEKLLHSNLDLEGKKTLMSLWGENFGQEFCSLLIKGCLEPSIPRASGQGEEYAATLLSEVKQMRSCLINLGFLAQEENCILGYTTGFGELFSKKMCQEKLLQARQLMKQNLYQSKLVGKAVYFSYQSEEALNKGSLIDNLQFPPCQISLSADDILNMVHQTLEIACGSSPVAAIRLYMTSRFICEMYCDIVPCFHKENLLLFPEQNAIFHNSCLYLSHHLTCLGVQYQCRLRAACQGQLETVTFADLADQLKRLGVETFLAQMRRQRGHLIDFLQEGANFQELSSQSNLLQQGSQAVQRCVLQLFSLRNVWAGVLPLHVFQRVMGTLCNSVLEELIFRILAQEDIPERLASSLDSVMGHILQQFPTLFQMVGAQEEVVMVEKVVPLWNKFRELKLVLTSSLLDIVDRWASRAGPLALEFTLDQVRHLIRALFQNTERRALALAKIK